MSLAIDHRKAFISSYARVSALLHIPEPAIDHPPLLSEGLLSGLRGRIYARQTLFFTVLRSAYDTGQPLYGVGLFGGLWLAAGKGIDVMCNLGRVKEIYPVLASEVEHPLCGYETRVCAVMSDLARVWTYEQIARWLESAGL